MIRGIYDLKRNDPTVIIGENEFKDMKAQLESVVNRNNTGLNDIMIKKMLLTYYRGIYLNDTTILMEVTPEEEKEFNKEKRSNDKAFNIIQGDKDKGIGEDGTKYLKTTGMVTIDNAGEQLIYYPKDILQDIYQTDYINKLEDNKNFADDVKNYLTRCYTTGSDGSIQIYAFTTKEETETYEYEKDGIKGSKESTATGSASLTTVNYNSFISQYITPVEFLVNLMEITGSKDFINAIMELTYEDNYVKLGLYEIENTSTEEIKTEYSQLTSVIGKKDDVTYTVKKEDGTIIQHIEEPIDGEEKVNIKVTSPNNEDCKVELLKNGIPQENTHGNIIKRELKKDNNWTYIWEGKEKPDQTENNQTDAGKVTITKTIKNTESKYDIGMEEGKTWYANISQTNTLTTMEQYSTKDKDGKEILIENKSEVQNISQADEEKQFTKEQNPTIIDTTDYKRETNTGEEGFLNSVYNYTLRQEEKWKDYNFDNMNINKTNVTKSTLITNKNTILSQEIPKVTDNTDNFLGLLSNDTGKYVRGATFKSKKSGGKVVKYPDLYESKTGVGELLVNGAEMLFELLDSTYTEEKISNTQGLSDIMRYILWRYSGIDYGITDFNQIECQFGEVGTFGFDFNVHVDKADAGLVLDEEIIRKTIEKKYSGNTKDNLLSALDGFMNIQENNKVNAVFAIAVTIIESSGGTNWSAIPPNTYNWMSMTGSYKGKTVSSRGKNPRKWCVYDSFSQATEHFGSIIAEGDYYFKKGRYTVKDIAPTYCNAEWGEAVVSEMTEFYKCAGVDSNLLMAGDFLSVAKQCHDYFWKDGNFYYANGNQIPYPNGTKYTDCSAYVSWVLYEYGYTEFKGWQKCTWWFMDANNWKKYGWQEIPIMQAEAGDIVVNDHHMEIYYGGTSMLNCGSTKAMNNEYTTYADKSSALGRFTKAIRVRPPSDSESK